MVVLMSKVVSVYDRKTSMRLTDIEWRILDKICYREKVRRKFLLEMIDSNRPQKLGFTSSVRLFALLYMYCKPRKSSSSQVCLQKALALLKW